MDRTLFHRQGLALLFEKMKSAPDFLTVGGEFHSREMESRFDRGFVLAGVFHQANFVERLKNARQVEPGYQGQYLS